MVMPFSGTISLSQANVELKKSATAAISLGDAAVRKLAEKTSGTISMSDLYGKSFEVRFINTVNRTQANIHTLMGSPTAPGVYIFENDATISAASRGGWALQTGAFPAGSTLTIINRGGIRGGGGNGGSPNTGVGGAGGTALVLNFPASINNSGTIWGGGGGGGGGYTRFSVLGSSVTVTAGGGGGAGIPAGSGGAAGNGDPRTAGSAGSATAGGSAGVIENIRATGGAPGAAGVSGKRSSGGGGAGGRGGYSVETNGNAATWIAVGDRKGSVV